MAHVFNPHASINSDPLDKTKRLNMNLPATLEAASVEQLRAEQRHQWNAENAKAIQAYNGFVENNGAFSDGLRKF